MPAAGNTLVPLGVVVGAHGVRGDLRVKPYNPSSELLLSLTHAFLRPAGAAAGEREVALLAVRQHSHGLLVTLEDCADRDAAQALRGAELCVPREHLPALSEGEHYLIDLIGLQARLADGQPLGEVTDAIEYPAGQALRVAVKDGTLEVPLTAPYVVEIRLDEGAVIVDHVEDLELEPARKRRR
jgi:16S rRNA processing protein RimM